MRFIVPILFALIISCSGNNGKLEREKKKRDSTAVAYRKYCDSVYIIKSEKFIALKKQIPFSQDYYEWYEITFSTKSSDQANYIKIAETTEPNLIISTDCYGIVGAYSVFNIVNEKKDVLFKTISQEQKDTILWKIEFLQKDSTVAEWSYKKMNDTAFTSRSSFMTKKVFDQYTL